MVIFFLISRDQKGHKEVDHILPLLYLLNNKKIDFVARGIIYGYESIISDKTDIRIKILSEIENVSLLEPYSINRNIFFKNVKKWLKNKNKNLLSKVINKLIKFGISRLFRNSDDKINWEPLVGHEFINTKNPIIVTLLSNQNIVKAVEKIKILNPSAKWIFYPHGTIISDNRMLMDTDLNRDESILKDPFINSVDSRLFTSRRDLKEAITAGLKKEKGAVIGSTRFCSEWMKIKQKLNMDSQIPDIRDQAKVRILFLIPKSFINIFNEELLRTIEFMAGYDEIDLILNRASTSYPKVQRWILKKSNVRDYLIAKEYSTGALVNWADIVIHVGTGVIFESLMKNKITVFPRYLTCNTLICEKYNAGWTLKNRDDLRSFCNMAVNSIADTRKKYFNDYGSGIDKYIEDFVYGNSPSPIENVAQIFNQLHIEDGR